MSASDKTLASASPASGNLALLAAIVVFAAITPTILMTAPAVAALAGLCDLGVAQAPRRSVVIGL